MADYKILGQELNTLSYTVPEGKTTVFSKIRAHNTASPARLSVSVGDASKFSFTEGGFVADTTFVDPNVSGPDGGTVYALAVQPDGKVLIGGRVTSVGGQTRNYAARVNADGTLDTTFADPNVELDVRAFAPQPDGKILIGGSFSSVGFQTRNRVARLNSDGTLDTTFVDPNVSSSVFSIALQPDGKVLIAGFFTSVGGQTRNRVARLNSDGTLDTTFDPNVNSTVRSIALQPDGKILIGGRFSSVGGQTRNFVARLNSDGTLDTTFVNPNVNPSISGVDSIALQSDGKVLIGGSFTFVGNQTRSRVARLNSNGTLDTTFVDPNVESVVYALAVQSDGKIVIGGLFTSVGGVTRNFLARLNSDGTLDTTFNPNVDSTVQTLTLQSDDKTVIGGWFSSVGGVTRNRVARIAQQSGGFSGPVDPSAYLIKDRSIFYDEVIEIAGGVALTEGQVLIVEQSDGQDVIIQAYGVEA